MILLTGSTGFLGRHVAKRLALHGKEIRCLVRRTSDFSVLQSLPVEIWHGDVTSIDALREATQDVDTVIHLVAIIRERGAYTFQEINHRGTRNVVEVAQELGVKRLIHLSAIGADPNPGYPYLFSKWQGEEEVRRSGIPYTILRPSLIFGQGGEFFNTLANLVVKAPTGLVKLAPIVPVPGSGQTRYQPIWVEDVAECIARSLDSEATADRTIAIGGPQQLTYNDIIDLMASTFGVKRWKLPLPVFMMQPSVWLMEKLMDNPPATTAELKMAHLDNITDLDAVQRDFGFTPVTLSSKIEYIRQRNGLPFGRN
jgi:uncharacterized protein YbjT (DUF2867 family)